MCLENRSELRRPQAPGVVIESETLTSFKLASNIWYQPELLNVFDPIISPDSKHNSCAHCSVSIYRCRLTSNVSPTTMSFARSPHFHHCFLPAPSFPCQKLSLSPKHPPSYPPRCTANSQSSRDHLYTLVTSAKSRTQQNSQLETLITALESNPQPNLALDPNLIGTWRNAYTSTPSSSSIIQRTVVSSPFVPRVEQIIHPDANNTPSKVLNRVDLRKLLGCVLNVRAAVEKVHHSRLSIRFDRAWFEFDRLPIWIGGASLPFVFVIPYPVPFRLLGDKACGWLDISYLDSDMRISRGNRGSCFVLIKEQSDTLPLTEQHLT